MKMAKIGFLVINEELQTVVCNGILPAYTNVMLDSHQDIVVKFLW